MGLSKAFHKLALDLSEACRWAKRNSVRVKCPINKQNEMTVECLLVDRESNLNND